MIPILFEEQWNAKTRLQRFAKNRACRKPYQITSCELLHCAQNKQRDVPLLRGSNLHLRIKLSLRFPQISSLQRKRPQIPACPIIRFVKRDFEMELDIEGSGGALETLGT